MAAERESLHSELGAVYHLPKIQNVVMGVHSAQLNKKDLFYFSSSSSLSICL
jgi:hypothetical protein